MHAQKACDLLQGSAVRVIRGENEAMIGRQSRKRHLDYLAGMARGLVRSRNGSHGNVSDSLVNSGDEVNTLVLCGGGSPNPVL
jgi:hypothetical protein